MQPRASRAARTGRAIACLAACLLVPAEVTADPAADELRASPLRTRAATIERGSERTPFERGAIGVEFTMGWLGEAWNLNDGREWLLDGTAAVWWTFADRLTVVNELHVARVSQAAPRAALVQGFSPQLRWAAHRSERWAIFVQLGPGLSWSDTAVPPRGTRFNYLLLAGSGVSHRLTRQCHAVAAFRWLHISNNGREGRGRNPDIEALGGSGGLLVVF